MNVLADHFRQTQLISARFISLPLGNFGNAPERSEVISELSALAGRRHPPDTAVARGSGVATTKASQRRLHAHPESVGYLPGMVDSPNKSLHPTQLRWAAEFQRWADVKTSLLSWGSGTA